MKLFEHRMMIMIWIYQSDKVTWGVYFIVISINCRMINLLFESKLSNIVVLIQVEPQYIERSIYRQLTAPIIDYHWFVKGNG